MLGPRNDWLATELAPGFTVKNYQDAVAKKARTEIADALLERFRDRYLRAIEPSSGNGSTHGFTKMAISCLLIESLVSFHRGWRNSDGKSKQAFIWFFDEYDEYDEFKDFRGRSAEFYGHVRCGILHQAETAGGWKTTRRKNAPLLDGTTVNADLFVGQLDVVIRIFCGNLKTAAWDAADWKNVRTKMDELVDNCRP